MIMKTKDFDSRCRAFSKRGEPCRAAATEGGLCFFHANPKKASELGRIGGRKNKQAAALRNPDPLPALETATAVRDVTARVINEIYAGQMHPRAAAGLAALLNLQFRSIETSVLERRIAKLEKRLAQFDKEQPENSRAA